MFVETMCFRIIRQMFVETVHGGPGDSTASAVGLADDGSVPNSERPCESSIRRLLPTGEFRCKNSMKLRKRSRLW